MQCAKIPLCYNYLANQLANQSEGIFDPFYLKKIAQSLCKLSETLRTDHVDSIYVIMYGF